MAYIDPYLSTMFLLLDPDQGANGGDGTPNTSPFGDNGAPAPWYFVPEPDGDLYPDLTLSGGYPDLTDIGNVPRGGTSTPEASAQVDDWLDTLLNGPGTITGNTQNILDSISRGSSGGGASTSAGSSSVPPTYGTIGTYEEWEAVVDDWLHSDDWRESGTAYTDDPKEFPHDQPDASDGSSGESIESSETGPAGSDPVTSTSSGLPVADARTVAYVYEAALDRNGNIDPEGLNFWIDAREAGLSEEELGEAFLDSAEFALAFGDPDTLSDRALVEILYANILDRDGELAGVEFWTEVVADPGYSRGELLVAFADSTENRNASGFVETLEETSPGYWDFVG